MKGNKSRLEAKERSKRFDFSKIDVDELNHVTELIKRGQVVRSTIETGSRRICKSVKVKHEGKITNKISVKLPIKTVSFSKPANLMPRQLKKFTSHLDCYAFPGVNEVDILPNSSIDLHQVAWTGSLCMSPIIRHAVEGTCCKHNDDPAAYLEIPENIGHQLVDLINVILKTGRIFQAITPEMENFIKTWRSLKNVTKFIMLLTHFVVTLKINQVPVGDMPDIIEQLLITIEHCFVNKQPINNCPGLVIIAPPGIGKTHFQSSFPYGFLDLDNLTPEPMDSNPEIVDALVNSGFSVITNRWEWRKWKSSKVAIFPYDLKRSLNSKNIYDDETYRRVLASKRKYFTDRDGARIARDEIPHTRGDLREWLNAYLNIDKSRDILFIRAKTFSEGYSKLLKRVTTIP